MLSWSKSSTAVEVKEKLVTFFDALCILNAAPRKEMLQHTSIYQTLDILTNSFLTAYSLVLPCADLRNSYRSMTLSPRKATNIFPAWIPDPRALSSSAKSVHSRI